MMKFRWIAFLSFGFLVGQNLTQESGITFHLMEYQAIQSGRIDPSLSVRQSYEWQGRENSSWNDLLTLDKGDSLFRRQKLKIYPMLSGSLFLNGGHLNPEGAYADISPIVTVYARYKLPPMGNYGFLFWGRFEKHSMVSKDKISDLTYNFHSQKEPGYQKNQGGDSTWVEYDIGDGGILFFSPMWQVSFAKSNPIWGPGYTGQLVLSNKIPSFVFLNIRHSFGNRWIFTLLHGKLNSTFRDSSHLEYYPIKGGLPLVRKYIAAHRLDYFASKMLRVGLGESVIYGGRGIEGIYFIPFMSYWSAQHDLSDSDNLQMFLDFDYIVKGRGRLYGALFLDEWDIMRTFQFEKSQNWTAYQLGITIKIPMKSLWETLFRFEWTHLSPYVYVHRSKINFFQHHGHYLGFWSGPNSESLFISLEVTPYKGWWIQIYGIQAQRGEVNDDTIFDQYNHKKVPFLFHTYPGDPEAKEIFGIRGEIYLRPFIRFNIDLFTTHWTQWLGEGTSTRSSFKKVDGMIQILIGI